MSSDVFPGAPKGGTSKDFYTHPHRSVPVVVVLVRILSFRHKADSNLRSWYTPSSLVKFRTFGGREKSLAFIFNEERLATRQSPLRQHQILCPDTPNTMSDSDSSLLRGAIQHSSVTRVLFESSNTDNASFFVFAASIVGLIGLCYLYCMFHVIRLWCCKPEGEAAVLVTDGFSFSLSARQRRAVLEAIFSDTSKVSSRFEDLTCNVMHCFIDTIRAFLLFASSLSWFVLLRCSRETYLKNCSMILFR